MGGVVLNCSSTSQNNSGKGIQLSSHADTSQVEQSKVGRVTSQLEAQKLQASWGFPMSEGGKGEFGS